MDIQCQECKTVYKIKEAKLPVQATKIKCKKCPNEIIVVRPPTNPSEVEHQANIEPRVTIESNNLNDQSETIQPTIPKSEQEENTGLTKLLYWIVDKAGFSSGIGIVTWGAVWLIWSFIQYFTFEPENIYQQMVHENFFNQAQLSAILIAIGVLIMATKMQKNEQQ